MSEQIQVVAKQQVLGKEFCIYGTIEDPKFLAKDVAQWIEHSNHRVMLDSVDDDEKIKCEYPVSNPYGGVQMEEQWFLTENGLYELLMQSRKPIAKQFKAEVKKILHKLRLTGTVSINPYANYSKAQWMRLAADQAEELETKQQQLLEAHEEITKQEETIKEQDERIEWIDGQRQDMQASVSTFAPVGKPDGKDIPHRGYWQGRPSKAPGRFNSRRNDAWDRMIKKAIKTGTIDEEDLEDLKVVVKADNLKGTKHTVCETLLLEMLDAGKIMVAPRPLIE